MRIALAALLFFSAIATPVHADPVDIGAVQARLAQEHPELPAKAIARAFTFYQLAGDKLLNRDFVTIIDFTKASFLERMFVIDMKTGAAETYLVAHGKNSGFEIPTTFSNEPNSYMSSLGIYLTGLDYIGDHGLSMRLTGIEPTNNNADIRDIVMHGADYVSHEYILSNGYLGRSLGCPAIEMKFREKLVNQLKNGSVFLIYSAL